MRELNQFELEMDLLRGAAPDREDSPLDLLNDLVGLIGRGIESKGIRADLERQLAAKRAAIEKILDSGTGVFFAFSIRVYDDPYNTGDTRKEAGTLYVMPAESEEQGAAKFKSDWGAGRIGLAGAGKDWHFEWTYGFRPPSLPVRGGPSQPSGTYRVAEIVAGTYVVQAVTPDSAVLAARRLELRSAQVRPQIRAGDRLIVSAWAGGAVAPSRVQSQQGSRFRLVTTTAAGDELLSDFSAFASSAALLIERVTVKHRDGKREAATAIWTPIVR